MRAPPNARNDIAPFDVQWPEEQVDNVKSLVRAVEPARAGKLPGWQYGCDPGFLSAFRDFWLRDGSVGNSQGILNQFPQFTAKVTADMSLHFVYVEGEAAGARPLLLLHGWPGSHFEFWPVIERLAFPSHYGGNSSAAFDLVIPSLPGFGFSSKPVAPIGARSTAGWLATLMRDVLGFDRYIVHGNDWGSAIAPWLALHPDSGAAAIHLNQLAVEPAAAPVTAEDREWATRAVDGDPNMAAYYMVQTTKPQSLAFMAANNPLGQAAWILERYHDWSNLDGRPFGDVFTMQALLTCVLVYVMTDSFATASWFYAGSEAEQAKRLPADCRINLPTGMSNWHDPRRVAPPRGWVERGYELAFWRQHKRGGHFPSMEEPGLLVDDLYHWAAMTMGETSQWSSIRM
jgi:pimeloyl-ACP methyl ester carboxylesterase